MKSSARSVELLLVEAGALWVQESPLALQAKRGGVFVVYEADEADLLRELAICIHRDPKSAHGQLLVPVVPRWARGYRPL